MGIDMKKISVVVLAAIISMLSVSPIHAADKPTSVPGCTTPTSKTHAPATVKEPMVNTTTANDFTILFIFCLFFVFLLIIFYCSP